MFEKNPCVYILASRPNGTLYIGVTSDLHGRMFEHTHKLYPGFTAKYGVSTLVYYEHHVTMDAAISREKRLKVWKRLWKLVLIEKMNLGWHDLFDPTSGEIAMGPFDQATFDPIWSRC
ncbi:MAG: GIY-YIG nuclease family protein [Hyphomicrobium sp.]|nr:GIY-YIG nuclease family protein [Hyphomicrobium sp.]